MLHAPLSLAVVGVQLVDQLLRTPLLAEPLQDAAAQGMGVLGTAARSLSRLLEPPPAGARYGYGLSDGIGLGLLWSALVAVLVVSKRVQGHLDRAWGKLAALCTLWAGQGRAARVAARIRMAGPRNRLHGVWGALARQPPFASSLAREHWVGCL